MPSTTVTTATAAAIKGIADTYPSVVAVPAAVAIAGAAPHGERLALECAAAGIAVTGVYDGNSDLYGTAIGECHVEPLEALSDVKSAIPVIACTHRLLPMIDAMPAIANPVVPFPVLHALHPSLFAPHPFYQGLQSDLVDHAPELQALEVLLSDTRSHAVLEAVLTFRRTLDPAPLAAVVEGDEYFSDILPLTNQEVLVDGGSYTGDTLKVFLKKIARCYRAVVAFEPDSISYAELEKVCAKDRRITCFRAGLYSKTTTLHFAESGREDAALTTEGGVEVPVVHLDGVEEVQAATLVRLNIEGAELEALEGAKEMLTRQRPKLAIAVYHRPDHLWRIPKWIEENLGSYHFHLRQHDGGLVETVLYAVPEEYYPEGFYDD